MYLTWKCKGRLKQVYLSCPTPPMNTASKSAWRLTDCRVRTCWSEAEAGWVGGSVATKAAHGRVSQSCRFLSSGSTVRGRNNRLLLMVFLYGTSQQDTTERKVRRNREVKSRCIFAVLRSQKAYITRLLKMMVCRQSLNNAVLLHDHKT